MTDPDALLRWRDDVSLRMAWSDRTPCGGPLGTRLEEALRAACAEATAALQASAPLADVHAALHRAIDGPGFSTLAVRHGGTWRIRPEVLRPDPDLTTPAAVTFVGADGVEATATLPPSHWAPAHVLFAELAGPGARGQHSGRHADMQTLLDGLVGAGFVVGADTTASAPAATPRVCPPGVTFVGHSTVLVASERTRVVVDPFLVPARGDHPAGYRPLTPVELGRLDAVLITHAHPDHCDPGTLLRLPPEVPVIVPVVEGETALAPDLAVRLRQLGHLDVRPRAAGTVEQVGDIEVHVLPFPGEQPSDAPRLHEEARNAGNTYVVRTPTMTVGCVADAGRDATGDIACVVAGWRRRHGPVDVLFAGYRGWYTYPAQLLLSSVARFFLFLDPTDWSTRLQLMNDADDAVSTAEACGARVLVPYSAGGAPWFWDRGLGPRGDIGLERPGFDPLPERVVEAAAERAADVGGGAVASPVEVVVLRPGDTLDGAGRRVRLAGHAWPYDDMASAS